MNTLPAGTIHNVLPDDLKKALVGDKEASDLWRGLTPLARNEWICWVISPKKQKTRDEHVKQVVPKTQGWHAPAVLLDWLYSSNRQGY